MSILNQIKNDKMIKKFSLYGFLKNLKFFEPYLVLYLLSFDITLFKIGLLYSIREIIIYIFEIPSGIIADHYGKKNELMLCFIFYIISFIIFFIGGSYIIFVLAMIFFGLGEAFRSGTHKSIILTYLESKDWFVHKTFVYGRTRSFSLLGTSLSSFVSILFIINLPATRWIFLVTTIPYVIDFFLIYSYPNIFNEKAISKLKFREFFEISKKSLKNIYKQKYLLKILINSSSYDGIFKTIKDYIQPILLIMIAVESEQTVKILLGMIYGIFFIFSSFASRNVYRLRNIFTSHKLMNFSYIIMSFGLLFIALSIYIDNLIIAIILFFVLYIFKDARRPIFVDLSSDYMTKKQRATVLSIESQLRSVIIIIFAPLFGLISDTNGIAFAFAVLSIVSLLFSYILKIKFKEVTVDQEE